MNVVTIENQIVGIDLFCRLAKASCATTSDVKLKYPFIMEHMSSLMDIIEQVWDEIQPYTIKECMELISENHERAAVFFRQLDVATIYKDYKDKRIVNTYTHKDSSKYVLWEIDMSGFGFENTQNQKIIQMWCPSTNKEYWVYAHPDSTSAKDAIGSSLHTSIPEDMIENIKRQGEVYMVKVGVKDINELRKLLDNPVKPINPNTYWAKITEQT